MTELFELEKTQMMIYTCSDYSPLHTSIWRGNSNLSGNDGCESFTHNKEIACDEDVMVADQENVPTHGLLNYTDAELANTVK